MHQLLKRTIITYSFFWTLFLAQCVTIFYCMINSSEQMKVLSGYGLIICFCGLLGGLAILSKRALSIDRFSERLGSKTGLSDDDLVSVATMSQGLPLFASILYFIMWNIVHILTFLTFKAAHIGNLSALSLLGGWIGGMFSCPLMVFGVLGVITIPMNTIFYDEISKRELEFKGTHFAIKSKLISGFVIVSLSLVIWLGGAAFYTGIIQIVYEMKSSEKKYLETLAETIELKYGDSISIDSLAEMLKEKSVGEKKLFLADKTGKMIYSAATPTTLYVEKWEDINQEIKTGLTAGMAKSIYINTNESIITFFPINDVYRIGSINTVSNRMDRFGPFIFWFIFFCIVGLSVSLVNGYALTIGTSRSINNAALKLKQLSEDEGDLTKRLSMSSEDEMGDLTRSFNAFMKKLRYMIGDISKNASTLNESSVTLSDISLKMSTNIAQMKDKSDNVSNAAKEVSLGMTAISATMEQTSVNTGHVAKSVEEMTTNINNVAENAGKALQITREAVVQSNTATDKMDKLGDAAKAIGKVTEVITDISEQTNLLALNATIEAARAGESGKGFAVVANEIKELSKQTAEATLKIKTQIIDMQKISVESIEEIKKISKTILDVNEITTGIASVVEEQSVTTKKIAGNIVHASQGIEEVKNNITQASTSSHSISNDILTISESAVEINDDSSLIHADSDNLMQLAGGLKEMVEKFKF